MSKDSSSCTTIFYVKPAHSRSSVQKKKGMLVLLHALEEGIEERHDTAAYATTTSQRATMVGQRYPHGLHTAEHAAVVSFVVCSALDSCWVQRVSCWLAHKKHSVAEQTKENGTLVLSQAEIVLSSVTKVSPKKGYPILPRRVTTC